ncbi:site-specific DNA-methyltransferase [Limosilactobacillus reuteri]|uniref:site-specific DNA-methyltransferase n=2 Tax=Limosilactobacillus reuteri TaxID=1598 RepID=UPI001CDAC188|nr:site-specific DNA-methyltransferase [Limosilactobacillus reuteri]
MFNLNFTICHLDKFKSQLKDKNINELSEGYQLNFIGKDYARRQAGEIPTSVIVPDEKHNNGEGKDSKNLFFTGDNLEVLRHLQTAYANKVDVIYIDPPYNTGSDGFVYPDSFEYSDDKLKDMFGLDDDQVERLKSIQGKASHSAWLTLMYPRLAIAKQLLTQQGIIFISIDDNEDFNLKLICDSIFGENNFIGQFVIKSTPNARDYGQIGKMHDYVLFYAKNRDKAQSNLLPDKNKKFSYKDNSRNFNIHPFYNSHDAFTNENRSNLFYTIYINNNESDENVFFKISMETKENDNVKIFPPRSQKNNIQFVWRWGKEKSQKYINQEIVGYETNGQYRIVQKMRNSAKLIRSIIEGKNYTSRRGTAEVEDLMERKIFAFPKPVALLHDLILSSTSENSTILDFFAGSSTTADAVMQLNAEDGGHRKFIMVQLPEKTYHTNKDGKEVPTKGGKAAYDAGFKSIDEISRERIRRAARKIKEDNELTLPADFDGSFKHYRVVKPTKQTLEDIDDFDPDNTDLFTNMVEGFSSESLNIPGNATGEQTILTTWLAQDGYSFDANVQNIQFDNYNAHLVDDRLYLINEGWGSNQTKELLNKLGTNELHLQSVVIFGYSFNIAELRELENGLKQLDNKVNLIKRY